MKILLAGPVCTNEARLAFGLNLEGAPLGYAQSPVVPLAVGLQRLGHQVHLLTHDPMIEHTKRFTEDGISITYCPLRAPPRYRTRVRALDLFRSEIGYLERAMLEAKPDIVHAHWTYEFAEAAVRSRLPHLVTMHDLGWDYFLQFRDAYRFMRMVMKYRTMPRVKALTVVAPFMRTKARHYGYFGPVQVVPNGVQVPVRTMPLQDKSERPPRIVTIGNAGRIKNVKASVEAFRIIKGHLPDAELHLFGPGLDSDFSAGETGIVGHGNTPHSDLMDFLENEATLLIHPSLLETFGVIIAEAKARGVPVVGGVRSGGVPFVCGRDAGCTLVDVRDPRATADAVLELIGDPEAYKRNAALAREDAAARFDIANVAREYVTLYESILRGERP